MPSSRSSDASSCFIRSPTGTLSALQRRRADAAGGIEPMAQLEPFDGFDEIVVVCVAGPFRFGHVVADDKMLAQQTRPPGRSSPGASLASAGSVGQPPRTWISA